MSSFTAVSRDSLERKLNKLSYWELLNDGNKLIIFDGTGWPHQPKIGENKIDGKLVCLAKAGGSKAMAIGVDTLPTVKVPQGRISVSYTHLTLPTTPYV